MVDTRYVNAMWQIMNEIKNANQLESVLSFGLEVLCEQLQCEEGYVWMLYQKDERIYAVACQSENDLTGTSFPLQQSFIGNVIQSGESLILNQVETDARATSDKDFLPIVGHNALLVPLRTPNQVIGCLLFVNKHGAFDEEDQKLAENCGALLALDIEDKGISFVVDTTRTPLISLRGVEKEFMSGEEMRRILNGIDLDIYEGELLVVLGESGCGKSTLLNIIGGMDKMTNGTLTIEGKDFSNPSEKELTEYRRDYIGFIFQSYNLMPNLSALENIEFIAEVSKKPLDSQEVLEMVGLGDRGNRYPSAMSGGQQQRVCIARAIVKDPKIILADEPTAALDFTTGQGVLKVIENIVKEHHTTVIMVTHNVEIAKMANRVIKLKSGKISSIRVNANPLPAESLSW